MDGVQEKRGRGRSVNEDGEWGGWWQMRLSILTSLEATDIFKETKKREKRKEKVWS